MIDHDINPQNKNKKWIHNAIKEYWHEYIGSSYNSFYNNRYRYDSIKKYALGMQDTSKYVDQVIPDKLANDDTTWERVNFEVFPLIPKFRRIILDILKKMRYEINVDVIDALADDDQAEYLSDIASRILLKEKMVERGADPKQAQKILGLRDSDPRDFDELEIHMKYTYKHQAAIEVETALDLIMTNERYSEVRDRVLESLFDFNLAVVREYEDYDGELKTEYIDIMDFVVSPTDDPYFSDISYAGEVKEMTYAEIANFCTKSEKKELKDLVDNFDSRVPRSRRANQYNDSQDGKFKVLRLEFISTNSERYETRVTKSGAKVFGKKTGGSKGKEIHEAEYDVVYSGYWVIDSDFSFDCKLETNMKRNHEDLKITRTSYHPIATELYRMETKSICEQMIPFADSACIAWYKLQNALIRAKPKGVMWELSSLQNLTIGDEEITSDENIMMYNLTGNIAYRRIDEDGDVAQWSPIEELEGGMGSQGEEFIGLIRTAINFAQDITGLNEVTDGSSPDPKMLKSVAQLAQLSSNNSIRHLHETERKLTDRVASDLMLRIQDQAQDGTVEGYVKPLGSNTVKFFKLSKDVSFRKMGIFFEEEPDLEDKQRLEERIKLALTPQAEGGYSQITIEDAHFIEGIKNTKAAMAYLGYKVRKNEEERERKIAEREMRNAQEQKESAMLAEQEKRKTAKFEASLEIKKLQYEWDRRDRNEKIKGRYMSQDEMIKANARDRENARTNETKRYIESQKEEKKESSQN